MQNLFQLKRLWRAPACVVLLATLAMGPLAGFPSEDACASGQAHAGVVIVYADGEQKAHCVEIAGASSTGIQALEATGVPVVVKQDPALGAFVCKIGNVGADLGDCPSRKGFWAYWHFAEGKWSFANTGAAGYRVKCGDVDGWVWTPGEGGSPPSDAAGFSAVCPGKTCAAGASEPPDNRLRREAGEPTEAAAAWLIAGAAIAGLGGLLFIWRLRRKKP